MSVKDAVIRAAVVKTIKDLVGAEELAAKLDVMGELDPGDRKGAILPDGSDVGTVSYTVGRRTGGWVVTDARALAWWAAGHHPDAVRNEPVLADWFTSPQNLKALAESGEVPDGIEYVEKVGDPYITVRQSDEQKAAALAALTSGVIDARTVLQLGGAA